MTNQKACHTISDAYNNYEALKAQRDELVEALKDIVTCEENRANDLRHREAWLPLKFSEERILKAREALKKAGAL